MLLKIIDWGGRHPLLWFVYSIASSVALVACLAVVGI